MPLQAEEAFLKRNPSRKLVIAVAIDGSTISDQALQVACSLYSEKRKDRLVILHVSDSRKTFLPKNLQPKYLESQYVDKAFALHVSDQMRCLPVVNQRGLPFTWQQLLKTLDQL